MSHLFICALGWEPNMESSNRVGSLKNTHNLPTLRGLRGVLHPAEFAQAYTSQTSLPLSASLALPVRAVPEPVLRLGVFTLSLYTYSVNLCLQVRPFQLPEFLQLLSGICQVFINNRGECFMLYGGGKKDAILNYVSPYIFYDS